MISRCNVMNVMNVVEESAVNVDVDVEKEKARKRDRYNDLALRY